MRTLGITCVSGGCYVQVWDRERLPGNLAVAKNGDVYFNYHPVAKVERFSPATVFKWSNGQVEPFPSIEAQKDFQGTFGMTIDKQNRIWFIEPASFDFKHARVSAFDLNTKKRVEFFEFPEGPAQFAEDIRITEVGGTSVFVFGPHGAIENVISFAKIPENNS
jgi:hypothetical protein